MSNGCDSYRSKNRRFMKYILTVDDDVDEIFIQYDTEGKYRNIFSTMTENCKSDSTGEKMTTVYSSPRHSEDIIVTPFAQVLHTLLNARDNVVRLTTSALLSSPLQNDAVSGDVVEEYTTLNNIDSPPTRNYNNKCHTTDKEYLELANKTVDDLDWCLKQLEAIQTTRSVSDMASSKFKRLLTKELNTMAGNSPTSNQVSKYIEATFLDDSDADMSHNQDLNESQNKDSAIQMISSQQHVITKSNEALFCTSAQVTDKTASETTVALPSGAKPTMTKVPIKLSSSHSICDDSQASLPHFGIETPHEVELKQRIEMDIDRWGMNIFELHDLANHRPLTAASYAIFERRGFMKKFNILPKVLITYFMHVEDHYRSDIPYHNSMHATDVVQSTHVLLNAGSMGPVFSDLDKLSCVFACAIHDVNHPGVTNQFLVNTKNELAIMYNDESVLENHHLAVAFRLLQEAECDIFAHLSARDHKTLRKMVIDMVLATDMSKHMSLLADLKTIVETKKVQGKNVLKLDSYADKIKILQNLVHCADLSNPAKPLSLYRMWTDRIMEEFFCQGDLEKKLGLEISPMCDRNNANIAASQVTFIDYIAHPLWEAWTELVHPDAKDILIILESNRDWYNKQLNLASDADNATDASKESEDEDEQIEGKART